MWTTTNRDVAANQVVRFTGENTPHWNPDVRQGVYVSRGIKGDAACGTYRVAVEGSKFTIRPTADAMEFVIEGEIPANEGVWYTEGDLEAIGVAK